MKRSYDLTEKELLSLSPENIERLIDYDCALEGVPLLPENPGPEPVPPAIVPDVTLYGIAGLYVKTMEEASKIFEAFQGIQLYDDMGYDIEKTFKPVNSDSYSYPKVTSEKFNSHEKIADNKKAIADYKAAKSEWNVRDKAYREAREKRKSIVNRVELLLDDAREKEMRRESLRRDFARYLALDADPTVAMKFLALARPDAVKDFPEVVQELCPGYGEAPDAIAAP